MRCRSKNFDPKKHFLFKKEGLFSDDVVKWIGSNATGEYYASSFIIAFEKEEDWAAYILFHE